MTSPITCTDFLISVRAQLAEGADAHYIDESGNIQENKSSAFAAHPVATTSKIVDLFNTALIDAIKTRNGPARAELLHMCRGGALEHICQKNARITAVARAALKMPTLAMPPFVETMLRSDAAKIIRREGITFTDSEASAMLHETLSLSSGSSVSSRSTDSYIEALAKDIGRAFIFKDNAALADLIPIYKQRLTALWIAKAAESVGKARRVLEELTLARARCLNVDEFDAEFGTAEAIAKIPNPQLFAEKVAEEAVILSMQVLIGSRELEGIESILEERIQALSAPVADLMAKLEAAAARELQMKQRLDNLARKEAARLEAETSFAHRSACYSALCTQSQVKPELTPTEFLALPGILDDNDFTIDATYGNRVRLWEASPLQRLLVGSRDGTSYEGSAADLYTQELLHSLPKASNLLANTCFASAYTVNPASRLRLSDSTVEFPGVRMLCAFEATNPWHSDSPRPDSLEKVLHGDEPTNILERQLRAALLVRTCDMARLQEDTAADRAEAIARAVDGRSPDFSALGRKQESLLLTSLRSPSTKDAALAAMAAVCAEETARGLGPTLRGAGHFTMSADLSERIFHRHLSTDDAADMGFLARYAAEVTHRVTVSSAGTQQFVFNIYNPLNAATHVGLLEVVVTDPIRGFTVRFFKEM